MAVDGEPPMVHDAFTVATPDPASATVALIVDFRDVPGAHEMMLLSSSQI